MQRLDCSQREELLLYVILTVPQDFRESTANLVAPLIINQESKKGFSLLPQIAIILPDTLFSSRPRLRNEPA